ncbi:uncharacterized protein [Drosophila pseudoobscura]|uniref:DUF4806 domain-containing protein n=1 Tax=Drosophila pseudoobscura pseudoobscura TaxID=46245 RepID=A0A6I8VXL6_DROPS|nr:uncharacterized protein LOC117184012 [Drosophila pseudoobscura]
MSYKRKSRTYIGEARHVQRATGEFEVKLNNFNFEEMGAENTQITDISNTAPNNRSNNYDILNHLKKIIENQQDINKKIETIIGKVDRQGAELISLRNEVASIKARVCGEPNIVKLTVPRSPLASLEGFESFEDSLNNLIKDLIAINEKTFDKFIRSSWRQIISDDVAKFFSWRGTDSKKCVRGLRTTLALRHAFKQKFALDDQDFDHTTQKHFQYAQERKAGLEKSDAKKLKF